MPVSRTLRPGSAKPIRTATLGNDIDDRHVAGRVGPQVRRRDNVGDRSARRHGNEVAVLVSARSAIPGVMSLIAVENCAVLSAGAGSALKPTRSRC